MHMQDVEVSYTRRAQAIIARCFVRASFGGSPKDHESAGVGSRLAVVAQLFVCSTVRQSVSVLVFGGYYCAGHLFLTITHLCLFLPPLRQTIWRIFSPCLRIWPVLCTHLLMMARVVMGSGGSDILCC